MKLRIPFVALRDEAILVTLAVTRLSTEELGARLQHVIEMAGLVSRSHAALGRTTENQRRWIPILRFMSEGVGLVIEPHADGAVMETVTS